MAITIQKKPNTMKIKDKFDAPINSEYAAEFQKGKAEKALQKAKQLEQQQQTEGKKYVWLNSKTRVLR